MRNSNILSLLPILVKCSNQFKTKSKNERIIPINKNIKTILKRKDNLKDDFVFRKIKGVKINKCLHLKQLR